MWVLNQYLISSYPAFILPLRPTAPAIAGVRVFDHWDTRGGNADARAKLGSVQNSGQRPA